MPKRHFNVTQWERTHALTCRIATSYGNIFIMLTIWCVSPVRFSAVQKAVFTPWTAYWCEPDRVIHTLTKMLIIYHKAISTETVVIQKIRWYATWFVSKLKPLQKTPKGHKNQSPGHKRCGNWAVTPSWNGITEKRRRSATADLAGNHSVVIT